MGAEEEEVEETGADDDEEDDEEVEVVEVEGRYWNVVGLPISLPENESELTTNGLWNLNGMRKASISVRNLECRARCRARRGSFDTRSK